MKHLIVTFACFAIAAVSQAQELATCTSPKGYANYAQKGIVPKKNAGWAEDKITGGITTLRQLGPDDFDILFVDATKSIISAKQDGGLVKLVRAGESDMTFLVLYPGNAIELFTFMRDDAGNNVMHQLSSKGGEEARIHKSSVMVANCSTIQFPKRPTN